MCGQFFQILNFQLDQSLRQFVFRQHHLSVLQTATVLLILDYRLFFSATHRNRNYIGDVLSKIIKIGLPG